MKLSRGTDDADDDSMMKSAAATQRSVNVFMSEEERQAQIVSIVTYRSFQ